MILQHLYDNYGISCYFDQTSQGTLLRSGEWVIYPLPLSTFHESSIEALAMVSNYLMEKGQSVGRILTTKENDFTTDYQGTTYVILSVPTNRDTEPLTGEALATFHKTTRMDQSSYNSERPYLNWSAFWQSRADQTYSWMEKMLKKDEPSQFEETLLKNYPYYAGRAENAIQYVVDLMIDTRVDEGASFCHHRLPASYIFNQRGRVEWPTEWVIDHPGRDLGEYLRTCCAASEGPLDEANHFLNSYREVMPISQVGASLAYARLLFPLTFFETVEGYYSGKLNEEEARLQLQRGDQLSEKEEAILRQFKSLGLEPIAEAEWL